MEVILNKKLFHLEKIGEKIFKLYVNKDEYFITGAETIIDMDKNNFIYKSLDKVFLILNNQNELPKILGEKAFMKKINEHIKEEYTTKNNNLIYSLVIATCITFGLSITTTQAAVDTGAAKALIQSYTTPITNLALWLIPVIALISLLVSFAKWYMLDDREKDQNPFSKTLKKHLIALAIAESLSTILKILGF